MNDHRGRILPVGPTDRTSSQRTPAAPLRLVPAIARDSFSPYIERTQTPRPGENDLTRVGPGRPLAEGQRIEVKGRVTDDRGRPLANALIEIWNANKWGRYTHVDDPAREPLDPNFLGVGRAMSDDDGHYRFWTILPGAYLARPDIGRWRPKHIHFSLLGKSARLVTQMYFAGDPYNATDPAFILLGEAQPRHIGRKLEQAPEQFDAAYAFDIVVGGRFGMRFEG